MLLMGCPNSQCVGGHSEYLHSVCVWGRVCYYHNGFKLPACLGVSQEIMHVVNSALLYFLFFLPSLPLFPHKMLAFQNCKIDHFNWWNVDKSATEPFFDDFFTAFLQQSPLTDFFVNYCLDETLEKNRRLPRFLFSFTLNWLIFLKLALHSHSHSITPVPSQPKKKVCTGEVRNAAFGLVCCSISG